MINRITLILFIGLAWGQGSFFDKINTDKYEYSGFSKIKYLEIYASTPEEFKSFTSQKLERIVENLCYKILPNDIFYSEDKYIDYLAEQRKSNKINSDEHIELLDADWNLIVEVAAYKIEDTRNKYFGRISVEFVTKAEINNISTIYTKEK